MMQDQPPVLTPTRPYYLRAVYEWLSDNQLTPYLLVNANVAGVEVPRAHVKDGCITLNIAAYATHALHMDNELIRFSARFNGVSEDLFIPIAAVIGLFAKENGEGMFFEDDEYDAITESQGLQTPREEVETESISTADKAKKSGLRLL